MFGTLIKLQTKKCPMRSFIRHYDSLMQMFNINMNNVSVYSAASSTLIETIFMLPHHFISI